MRKNVIDIITLGCSKNLVDSENLMGKLEAMGYHCTHDSECPDGEIAVINTCGFINDAKEESINTILEFAQRKTQGQTLCHGMSLSKIQGRTEERNSRGGLFLWKV